MKPIYLLSIVSLFACNVGALCTDYVIPIDSLNIRIESQIIDVYSSETFELQNRLDELDELSAQCEEQEYLAGDVQILHLKIITAMELGSDELLNEWLDEYGDKAQKSVGYGLPSWELYYKSLQAVLSIYINGFERYRSTLDQLIDRSEIAGVPTTQSVLLLEVISNVNQQEAEEYLSRLDAILRRNDNISIDFSYFTYLLFVGNNYASVDSTEQALESYSQADSVASSIGMDRLSSSARFLGFCISTESLPLSPENITISLEFIEGMMQHEFLGDYSSEVLRVADSYIAYEQFVEAEELLTNCLRHIEEEFIKSKHHIDNIASSRYYQMRSTLSTDELQAEIYYQLYYKLAVLTYPRFSYHLR